MPPKKGKPIKKKVENDEDEENLAPVDVRYDVDTIQSILRDLEARVEAKCVQIKKETDFMATSVQQAFHLELIKIPTQVKQMPMSVFREDYGESLEAVTRGTIMGKTNMDPPRTSTKNAKNSTAKVFQTPVGRRGGTAMAPPSARHPRLGETILSQNGSPLGTFQTVVKAPKSSNNIVPATPGVFIPLSNGEIVDLDSVDSLTDDQKHDALAEMQKLQQQMQQQMQNLMKKMNTKI
jgi:hypothetical protein